jgi:hypothetical protein
MFFGRPISLILILVVIAMVGTAFWQEYRGKKRLVDLAGGH